MNTMDGASALFFCSTGGRLCSSMYVCLHVLKKFLLALTRIWGVDVSTTEILLRYLVDPASGDMLRQKIKPCMSKNIS